MHILCDFTLWQALGMLTVVMHQVTWRNKADTCKNNMYFVVEYMYCWKCWIWSFVSSLQVHVLIILKISFTVPATEKLRPEIKYTANDFNFMGTSIWRILYTALNSCSLIFALYFALRLIRSVLNLPTLPFSYIALYIQFSSPSFNFALKAEGEIFPVYSEKVNLQFCILPPAHTVKGVPFPNARLYWWSVYLKIYRFVVAEIYGYDDPFTKTIILVVFFVPINFLTFAVAEFEFYGSHVNSDCHCIKARKCGWTIIHWRVKTRQCLYKLTWLKVLWKT